MPSTGRLVRLLFLLACLGLTPGCAQLKLSRSIAWLPEAEEPPVPPAKIIALWSNAVLQSPDRPPTRGFGGKLMFFGAGENKPVRVDGSLVVYAFVEEGRAAGEVKPDRKFVFTPEQFATHYGKSKLGHSYSVWLPWDEAGGPQTEISLIARFTPAEGPTIVGEQTKHVLPGKSAATESERLQLTRSTPHGDGRETVRTVAYEAAGVSPPKEDEPADETAREMDVQTIFIPPRFGRLAPVARTRSPRTPPVPTLPQTSTAPSPGEDLSGPGQTSAATTPQPGVQPTPPRATRSVPARSRAPGGPIARSARDRARWQPCPAKWPSRPEPPHPAATASESE